MHPGVMSIQYFIKLIFELWRDNMQTCRSVLYLIDKIKLSFDIGLFLIIFGLESLLKYFITVQHGQPLQSRHKFVYDLADLVSICNAASEDLDIILSQ